MRKTMTEIQETRTRVLEAFAKLRKQGMIARANFMCCGGCAVAAIAEMFKARPLANGFVYWHSQDDENFKKDGEGYLGYGAQAENGEASQNVGRRVVEALRVAGLEIEWNGEASERIFIKGLAPKVETVEVAQEEW